MMISPEKYYEEYLKGKTAVQIMTAIRGLKNLIGHQRHRNIYPIYGQAFRTTIKHFAAVTKKIWRVTEKIEKFTAKPDVPENNFNVSMVPWTTFEGFNINISDFKYLLPIFTISH